MSARKGTDVICVYTCKGIHGACLCSATRGTWVSQKEGLARASRPAAEVFSLWADLLLLREGSPVGSVGTGGRGRRRSFWHGKAHAIAVR